MRYLLVIGILVASVASHAQTMTMITTLHDGSRDTVKFGFVQNATLGEDISLGEENLFNAPVQGYEGRILQRDSLNFSCGAENYLPEVYFPENFDSNVNYRDIQDTSLQNRLFEVWYSDGETDSVEMICDIPLGSFLFTGYQHLIDCGGEFLGPIGILDITDDTTRHVKYKIQNGFGIKEFIFITDPNITITALKENKLSKNNKDISLYPNPTDNTFFFQNSGLQNIEEIFIYNSIGKLMEHFDYLPDRNEINLERYESGSYILIFMLKNGERIIKKIIKQ